MPTDLYGQLLYYVNYSGHPVRLYCMIKKVISLLGLEYLEDPAKIYIFASKYASKL